MAKIGDVLYVPENGWIRFDDVPNKNLIEYVGEWKLYQHPTQYGESHYYTEQKGASLRVGFSGPSLRLIARTYPGNKPNNTTVIIDGIKETFTENMTEKNRVLVYEKTGLSEGNHLVEIITPSDENWLNFNIDAFDVKEGHKLIHPNKVNQKPNVSLYKRENGKIFLDDFDSINPEWIISPSDSFSIAARKGFIRLNHTADKDVMLLINKPQGDIAIQVIADYTPDVEGDKGGLIIYQNADNKIEFLESHSINSSKEHREWLATSTGEQWDFYSKVDATFDYADSDKLEATKIGVVLKKGVADPYKPLDIDRIIITSGHKLKLRQLFPNNRVILRDENGTTLSINQVGKLNTGIDINLPSLEFQGTIEVYDEQNSLIAEKKTLFYGGDIYNMGSPLKIIMDSKELNDTDPTNLGNMIEGKRIIKMMVQNENSVAVHNLKISIEQYMEKVGYTWANISLDSLAWVKQISINTLSANSSREFWVLVTKDLNYIGFEPILFNIKLQHD
ncbi:cell adhesion protein [Bacillus cereus]|uniref:cell adhesion protein n=1 Tax=Bacillus cereus group TaxID=86661 RepID=UPI0009950B74|nr:cell adhesion protein [Bacillus cereus]OPA43454.1 cell adhesion protein [Bacillus cereus]